MNQPSSGPGPSRGPARRGAAKRLCTAVIGLLMSLALIVLPAAGHAVDSPSPPPPDEPGMVSMSFVPIGRGIVRTASPLLALSMITNDSHDEAPAASLITELGDRPLADPSTLDVWLTGLTSSMPFTVIDAQSIPAIPSDASANAAITVAADAPVLARAPGVYPLRATYNDTIAIRTVVVIVDDAASRPTVPVGVIVPLTAGPRSVGLLDATALSTLTDIDGRLTEVLDAVQGTAAVLAIDPAILASIRVLGRAAPASATAWLERLNTLANPRFALQFADADVSAQIHAGLTHLLSPTSLDYAMSEENFIMPPPATPSPSGTTAPDAPDDGIPAPVLPDLAALLEVPGAIGSVYWPAGGRTDDDVITTLSEWARADEPAAQPITVLSSEAIVSESASSDPFAKAPTSARVGADASVLLYDSTLSTALQNAAQSADGPRGESLVALSAHLSLALDSATGPLLITADRLGAGSSLGLQSALSAILEYPGVSAASWSDLVSVPTAPITLADGGDDARVAALTDMLRGEDRIAAFATVLGDPSLLTAPERTAMLQLIGAGWVGDSAWAGALAEHTAATKTTLESVSIQPPTTIQLLTAETPLPFYVRNALKWPVNVVLTASPDNLRLDVDRTTNVIAEPGANTRVPVPVRARVGNGEVTIELRLLSPTAEQIGPVRHAEVHVRADWELLGVIVLAVLVGGLLLIGVYRTVRRLRAVKAGADAGEEPRG